VTPFAAGCAICGADLERARAELASKRRISGGGLALPDAGGQIDWVHVAIAVGLALAVSPIGLLLALYWANRRYRSGERLMTWLMLAAAALAVAAMAAPFWFEQHLYGV
jgi:hypothetical protein